MTVVVLVAKLAASLVPLVVVAAAVAVAVAAAAAARFACTTSGAPGQSEPTSDRVGAVKDVTSVYSVGSASVTLSVTPSVTGCECDVAETKAEVNGIAAEEPGGMERGRGL